MVNKVIQFIKGAYIDWNYPSSLKVLAKSKRVVVYYGYLGDYNYGDIMVYEAAQKLLGPQAIIVPVKRHMPPLVKWAVSRLPATNRKLVIGGGTLMGTVWEGEFFTKFISPTGSRVLLHGTGSTSGISEHFWRDIISHARYGGVRGVLSREAVRETLSLDVEVVGDAAFGLYEDHFWKPATEIEAGSLLINFGTHHEFPGMENSRGVISGLARAAVGQGKVVSFLPMHKTDEQLAAELQRSLPELIILPIPKHIDEAVAVFHRHAFAIGERLHFVVLALLSKSPFLSVNYRPKHRDLLDSVGMLQFGYDARDLTGDIAQSNYVGKVDDEVWAQCQRKLKGIRAIQAAEYQKFFNADQL